MNTRKSAQASGTRAKRVAIIGAGPCGIACARYLILHGAEVTIFERHSSVGGQWDSTSPYSAIWSSMHTNSCSLTTRFSDMEHPEGTAMFPHHSAIQQYLVNYADQFHISTHCLFNTEVLNLSHVEECNKPKGNWEITWRTDGHNEESGFYDDVVLATGRCSTPNMPDIPGIQSFTGYDGIIHSSKYQGTDQFEGKKVLVLGGSTSGCEIAADIAMRETKVISSVRHSRYVFQRIMGGRPAEYINLTRFGTLWSEVISPDEDVAEFKEFIVSRCGSPEQYGGIKPFNNVMEAGATMSQEYLLFIAEDRIVQKPWVRRIAGQKVFFVDGTEEDNVDAIVLCTGFNISMPFLSDEIRDILQPQDNHLPLAWFTMHPELPNMYFSGYGLPNGSMHLLAEQQARFIAYQCCDVVRPVPKAIVKRAFSNYMANPTLYGLLFINRLSIQLARLAGFEANISAYPELARYLLFGPLTPATFRLTGADALPDGIARVIREAGTFSQMTSPIMTKEETALLHKLAERKDEAEFSALVHKIMQVQDELIELLGNDSRSANA